MAIAIGSFFSILARPELAAGVAALRDGSAVAMPAGTPAPAPAAAAPAPAPVPPPLSAAPATAALQLLGLLQRQARFVDFVQEDVAQYSDAEIGAAARVVHEGCRKVLAEHFTLAPVRTEPEGSRITLQPGFDAARVRVTGNVVGQPPFTGTLAHRGWQASDVRLPQLTDAQAARTLAQAEVEL